MSGDDVNKQRRRFLISATSAVGAVGVGLAAVPFIKSWNPSAKAQAVGAPVKVSIDKLEVGQIVKIQWRGQPIGVVRRSQAMLNELPNLDDLLRDPKSTQSIQPKYADNEDRAIKPEYLVVTLICTHLGCVPELVPQVGPQPFDSEWKGGFFCPCHKSRYDLSGRVFKGVPAPTNLTIPPYYFVDNQTVMIGADPKGAA